MSMEWPKLMCACGHMADAKNNTTICNNCWQTARLMVTGDGAHDRRAENANLRQELKNWKDCEYESQVTALRRQVEEQAAKLALVTFERDSKNEAIDYYAKAWKNAEAALSQAEKERDEWRAKAQARNP